MIDLEAKKRYELYCEREHGIPIFSQPWWMDAICGQENWGAYLVGNGNDIKASIAFYINNDSGKKRISRALLTQNNGIVIKYPPNQGIIAKQKYEEKIVDDICNYIEELGLESFDQQFNYKYTNFLPFFWRYYQGTVKYTYVIENTEDLDAVRNSYSSKIKNELRKAQKCLTIQPGNDLGLFYKVNKLSFDRQNIDIPYSYEQFKRLYEACKDNHACSLIQAVDADGKVVSVAMLVWDNDSIYYLLNGTDPELKMLQGNLLLIDYGIELAHKKGLKFDFEGSVIKNVNHAFREFGGTPKPYFRITKKFD